MIQHEIIKKNIEIDIFSDFKHFCNFLQFDLNIKKYQYGLIDWNRLDNIVVLRNQFFYINDFVNAVNVFVHPNCEAITGYSPGDFKDIDRVYKLIHPDDRNFVFEFSKRTIAMGVHYREILKKNPFHALFSIDFRLKNREGKYFRVNRKTTCFKTDLEGNMVYALVLFTDISGQDNNKSYNIYWMGDDKNLMHVEDLLRKYGKDYRITKREKEILKLLSEGLNATQIAEKLFLSVHTVISHRKHLLKKTGARNSAGLTKFAAENSLI